jgi:hypothetical protein
MPRQPLVPENSAGEKKVLGFKGGSASGDSGGLVRVTHNDEQGVHFHDSPDKGYDEHEHE